MSESILEKAGIEGLRSYSQWTDEERECFDKSQKEMREEVIPKIVEACRRRRVLAQEARNRIIFT